MTHITMLTLGFYIANFRTLPHLKLRATYPYIALPDTCTGRRESYPGLSRCQWLMRIVPCCGGVTRLHCLDSSLDLPRQSDVRFLHHLAQQIA